MCFALKKICTRTNLVNGLYSCRVLGTNPILLHSHLECCTKLIQIVDHANCRASSWEYLDICSGIWHWLFPVEMINFISRND